MNRMMIAMALLAAALLFGVAACQTTPPVPPYDGAMLYQGYCASCHGPTGMGDGPLAAKLMVLMQDLKTIQIRNGGVFPRKALETVVEGGTVRAVHGTPDMPVWGWAFYVQERQMGEEDPQRFANARISALIDYLETIQTRP